MIKGKIVFPIPFIFITIGFVSYELYVSSYKGALVNGIIGGLSILLMWNFGKIVDKYKFLLTKSAEQNEELNALFDNDESFLWSNDLVNKKIRVSKGIEEITGFTIKEFEDDYELWIKQIYPEDKDKVLHIRYSVIWEICSC